MATAGAPPFVAAEKNAAFDSKLVASARAAAASAHVDAVILLSARKSKRGTVVHVWLVDAKGDGSAEVDQILPLGHRASVGDEADAAWNAIAQGFPAPPPETRTSATEPPPPTPPSEAPAAAGPVEASPQGERDVAAAEPNGENAGPTRANDFFSIGAALQAGSRSFSYVDRLTPTLRSYGLFAAPLVMAQGEIYPLARTHVPVLADFAITADYGMAFGLSSSDSTGSTSSSTSWQLFDVGARERIPVSRAVLLGVHGGLGGLDYSLGSNSADAQLPNVEYRFLRGGPDAHFVLGPISLSASRELPRCLVDGCGRNALRARDRRRGRGERRRGAHDCPRARGLDRDCVHAVFLFLPSAAGRQLRRRRRARRAGPRFGRRRVLVLRSARFTWRRRGDAICHAGKPLVTMDPEANLDTNKARNRAIAPSRRRGGRYTHAIDTLPQLSASPVRPEGRFSCEASFLFPWH